MHIAQCVNPIITRGNDIYIILVGSGNDMQLYNCQWQTIAIIIIFAVVCRETLKFRLTRELEDFNFGIDIGSLTRTRDHDFQGPRPWRLEIRCAAVRVSITVTGLAASDSKSACKSPGRAALAPGRHGCFSSGWQPGRSLRRRSPARLCDRP